MARCAVESGKVKGEQGVGRVRKSTPTLTNPASAQVANDAHYSVPPRKKTKEMARPRAI